jgi:5-enolpyruvylshikimate-3-phosphate synthase
LSSQFLTALLLLGPLTAEGLSITVTDLVSAPYVEITTAMMERFGIGVERDGDTYFVPSRSYTATDYLIEPDASTANYFLAAAALTGRSITILGARVALPQGDLRFAGVLSPVGADVTIWIEIQPARPHPAHIACHGDHRIAMAFSIAGLRTPGITLDSPGCVKKTFPGFHAALAALQTAWRHDQ